MSAGFAPGLWRLSAGDETNIFDGRGRHLATAHCGGTTSVRLVEAEANAHLIAAAPELLSALQALFASYKQLADSGDAGFWSIEDQPEGKQALAAIARALPNPAKDNSNG